MNFFCNFTRTHFVGVENNNLSVNLRKFIDSVVECFVQHTADDFIFKRIIVLNLQTIIIHLFDGVWIAICVLPSMVLRTFFTVCHAAMGTKETASFSFLTLAFLPQGTFISLIHFLCDCYRVLPYFNRESILFIC